MTALQQIGMLQSQSTVFRTIKCWGFCKIKYFSYVLRRKKSGEIIKEEINFLPVEDTLG